MAEPSGVEQKLPGVAADRSGGEWEERQKGQNLRIDLDLIGLSATCVGAKNAITSIRRKRVIADRQAFDLVEAFIIAKEESLIFFNGSAHRAAELVATKR